jgi:hypothetical protein
MASDPEDFWTSLDRVMDRDTAEIVLSALTNYSTALAVEIVRYSDPDDPHWYDDSREGAKITLQTAEDFRESVCYGFEIPFRRIKVED